MRLIRWLFAGLLLAGLALPGCSREESPHATATVEPSRVALNDDFVVRVAMAKGEGLVVGIFQAGEVDNTPALTSQPLAGAEAMTAEFGTVRLKPGSYIAAVTDSAGKRLASAEFVVTEPAAKARVRVAKNGLYPGDPIEVTWTRAPGGKLDWIGIYKVGEPNLASYLARIDTNASVRGTATFEATTFGKALTPGKYEARLMRDGSYVELANAQFVVANPDAKPEVSVAPERIRMGEPITVSFKDAPGNQHDWIGLYKAGESDTHRYLTWLYTDGAIAGQVSFDKYRSKLPPGEYVARLLLDNGYKELASARFWMISADGAPLLTLAKPRIKPGEPVEVRWMSVPADERAWIGIYKVDDLDVTRVLAQHSVAMTDGAVTFKAEDFSGAFEPGEYKVRLMREDRSTELASAQFRVVDPNAGPQVTLAKTQVKSGEPFQVSWKGSPGNKHDWIGIYKADVSNTHSYITWLYTDGAIDGAVTFSHALQPGEYVARLLVDNGYEEAASSTPFTVTVP